MGSKATRRRGWRKSSIETLEDRRVFSADPLGGLLGGGIEHHAFVESPASAVSTVDPGEQTPDFWYDDSLDQDLDQLLGDVEQLLNSAHDLTGMDQVRQNYGFTGIGQTVAIVDSGIAYNHYALGGGLGANYRVVGGWDFTEENDANPYDDGTAGSHGTHVSGIVGADATGTVDDGVAPGVDFVGLRVFNDSGAGYFSWVENALQWVHTNRNSFENPITAVNLSLGTAWNSATVPSWAMLEDEFTLLEADGIFISVSAGNSFTTYNAPGLSYPAASSHVVPVMSLDDNGALSYYSQRHTRAIGAPGRTIYSTVPDYAGNNNGQADDWANMSGTSMAAPYAAGASVIVRQAMELVGMTNITEWTIYDHMMDTADDFYDSATSLWYKRLNLETAIDALMPADDYGSTSGTAFNLGTISTSTQVSGLIGRLDDFDYFKFTAGTSGTVTFTADPTDQLAVVWSGSGTPNGNLYTLNVTAGQQYTVGISTSSGLGYYDLDITPATAFTYTDWGTITQSQTNNVNQSGTKWYRVTASQAGYMTAEAFFNQAAGNVDLAWFNASLQQVAAGVPGTNSERVDRTVSAGEQLYLRVTGTNADVDFQLTNLVSLVGTTVNVTGTGQADTFAYTGGSSHTVTVNSVAYNFGSGAVLRVNIDGNAGSDVLTVKSGSVAALRAYEVENAVDLDAKANSLNLDHGLRFSSSYYLNWAGFNEKWMMGNASWYIITPDGSLRRWANQPILTNNPLITQLDATYYADPSLVHESTATGVMLDHQMLNSVANLGLHLKGSYYLNWGGLGEKWVYSNTNQAYFITPNGDLWQWAGGSSVAGSTFIGNLDPKFHTDPTLLLDVYQFGAFSAMTANQLDASLNLHYQGSYSLNWGGWGEKWIRGNGSDWYFITPSGGFYQWNKSNGLANSPLLATFDPSYHTVPARLHDTVAPTSMSEGLETSALASLDDGVSMALASTPTNGYSSFDTFAGQRLRPTGTSSHANFYATARQLLASRLRGVDAAHDTLGSHAARTTTTLRETSRMDAFHEFSLDSFDDLDWLSDSSTVVETTSRHLAFSQLAFADK